MKNVLYKICDSVDDFDGFAQRVEVRNDLCRNFRKSVEGKQCYFPFNETELTIKFYC